MPSSMPPVGDQVDPAHSSTQSIPIRPHPPPDVSNNINNNMGTDHTIPTNFPAEQPPPDTSSPSQEERKQIHDSLPSLSPTNSNHHEAHLESSPSAAAGPFLTHQSRITEHLALARADMSDLDPEEGDVHVIDNDEDEGFVAVDHDDVADYGWYFRRPQAAPSKRSELDELHPFVQLLSLSNVEDCMKVEAVFPEKERCSREKLTYRLTKCPELSLGIFSLPRRSETPSQTKPRPRLVAHVIATRTPAPHVTDASMDLPTQWDDKTPTLPRGEAMETDSEPLGHQDQGTTIAVHSLAVLPGEQGKGLGTTLIKAYIQRIKDAAIAERIALIAHDDLIQFYEGLGFEDRGESECKFAGGGWRNMVLEFSKDD